MSHNATELAGNQPADDHRREHGRLHQFLHSNRAVALTTKIAVAVVGGLIALVGVVMIVTPGPAFVLIPLGLAILATEFAFARQWLTWARDKAAEAKRRSADIDPAVRRRRLVLTGLSVLVVLIAVSWYVVVYDWPEPAVDGWNWVQSVAGWVPELPRM